MKKEILHFKDFSFFLKTAKELSNKEKDEMHEHLVKLYPAFRIFYEKNKYYSTIKPQLNLVVRKNDILVGVGKFLWRNAKIKDEKIKLFVFGMLIDNPYQGQGIGTEMIRLDMQEARKRKASLLYGSTANPIMEKIMIKEGFKKIKVPVTYKDLLTKEIKKESNPVYVFEFEKGLISKINKLKSFHIGIGPI